MAIIEIRMPNEEKEGTEASVGRWLRQAGDRVQEHEPLVEVATDKVTLEIAAPANGILVSIARQAGDTIQPGELLGTLDTTGHASHKAAPLDADVTPGMIAPPPATAPVGDSRGLSPIVRRMLEELKLDPSTIAKTARGTRITPADIAAHLAARTPVAHEEPVIGRLVAHTPMRKAIAAHMSRSVQMAPHVTAVFEADMQRVFQDRETRKQAGGAAPSVTAYIIHAAVRAIQQVPEVNSRWRDAHLELFDHVNFGVGTALATGGLVVPVIRNADSLDLSALDEALRAATAKARDGKITQADMDGGTFTLSNHGVSGSLLAAPIILPHGQAAILGTGKVQKRPVVCETGGRELFRIRPMMYVTLTVDHRVLDGQQTNAYMTAFVRALETLEGVTT